MAKLYLILALFAFALNGSLCFPADFEGNSDEVKHLPGLDFRIHYKHYSGYLESANKSHLHYWFFESQRSPSKDPVVLWLNGGPGCSSLLGALTEQGPITMELNGRLKPNPKAWNLRTNLLFLESPAGVGFSYNDAGKYKTNDKETAELNFEALKSFFRKFPHLRKNDFYITGESYGGVYVPTLSEKCLDRKFPENFKGFAVGNGYLDQTLLGNSFLHFTAYHGLYDQPLWEEMVDHCCKGIHILRKCDFVNSKLPKCKASIKKVQKVLNESPLNWYNIYGYCNRSKEVSPNTLYPEQVAKRFLVKNLLQLEDVEVRDDPPCLNYDYVQDWINQKSVRHALHIRPAAADWSPCSQVVDYTNQYTTLKHVVRKLLKAGLKGLIYNGDVDTACNYLGDQWFAEELGFKTIREYQPWLVKETGQVGGYVKVFEHFAYTTIRGSGHMVPEDKPGAALQMFHKFIDS